MFGKIVEIPVVPLNSSSTSNRTSLHLIQVTSLHSIPESSDQQPLLNRRAASERTPAMDNRFSLSSRASSSRLADMNPPQRHSLRPKLSSYLSASRLGTSSKIDDVSFGDYFSAAAPKAPDVTQAADPEIMLEGVQARLLMDPSKGLPPQYNSSLLHVIEAYRNLLDERNVLQKRLAEANESRYKESLDHQKAQGNWVESEDGYKAEIKRLELIIAKGETGMTAVMKARQNSVIDRKQRLRRSDEDDPQDGQVESSKHVEGPVSARRRMSPSRRMIALSRRFRTKAGSQDLPVGTLREQSTSFLAKGGYLRTAPSSPTKPTHTEESLQEHSRHRPSVSTTSSYSADGDPLPDEIGDSSQITVIQEDYEAIQHISNIVAERRGETVHQVLPKMVDLYYDAMDEPEDSLKRKEMREKQHRHPNKAKSLGNIQLVCEAQAGAHNLQRVQEAGTTQSKRRPWSFEPGDDKNTITDLQQLQNVTPRGERLRRSLSLSSARRLSIGNQSAHASPTTGLSVITETRSSPKPDDEVSPFTTAGAAPPPLKRTDSPNVGSPVRDKNARLHASHKSGSSSQHSVITVVRDDETSEMGSYDGAKRDSSPASNAHRTSQPSSLFQRRKNKKANEVAVAAAARAVSGETPNVPRSLQ